MAELRGKKRISVVLSLMIFFQLMTRRYEHASTVLTSNEGFEEWGEIFGDEVIAAAQIDRLGHRCHLVTILVGSNG